MERRSHTGSESRPDPAATGRDPHQGGGAAACPTVRIGDTNQVPGDRDLVRVGARETGAATEGRGCGEVWLAGTEKAGDSLRFAGHADVPHGWLRSERKPRLSPGTVGGLTGG